MRSVFTILILCITCICISSCEKVVEVNLKDSAAKYIIEGEINDGPGPYEVRITKSKNFSDNNDFEGLSGALVTLSDVTLNSTERLIETDQGVYHTTNIKGIPGHLYKLEVSTGDQLFSATSVMPKTKVRLDTIYTAPSDFNDEDIFVVPVYTDPVGTGNYYRLRQYINGKFLPGSIARSDKATDGRKILQAMSYRVDEGNGKPQIKAGDHVMVQLQCIDEGVYDYFRTFENATSDNSSNPANPLTNFKGGALGVFNACRISSLETVAEFKKIL